MAAPCSQWIACSPVRKSAVPGRSTRSLDMRREILRSLVFAATGAAAVTSFQIALLVTRGGIGRIAWNHHATVEALIVAVVAAILSAGALIGFGCARHSKGSVREAAILGGVAAIPIVLAGGATTEFLGPYGAAGAAIALSAVFAFVGGGGLRRRVGAHV